MCTTSAYWSAACAFLHLLVLMLQRCLLVLLLVGMLLLLLRFVPVLPAARRAEHVCSRVQVHDPIVAMRTSSVYRVPASKHNDARIYGKV